VPKSGRQGEFVLSTVETRLIRADGVLAVVESQDIVYRRAVPPAPADRATVVPPAREPVEALLSAADEPGRWRLRTDPIRLMRFSAATANGHRIHYDLPYAVGVEGYPGLVVHGPLMTLSMLETVRLRRTGPVTEVTHRNVRPLYCGQEALIRTTPADGASELTLSSPDAAGDPAIHVTARVVTAAA
jgi:3-methylfumaryl-CoA hydratase